MSRKKQILKDVGIYAFSSQLTQLITLAAAILSRRFLGPMQMGIWATLQIIVDYSKYASLGSMHAIAREIPYYNGKGNKARVDQIRNDSFSMIVTGGSIVACLLLLFSLFTWGRFDSKVAYGLLFVVAIVLLQLISNMLIQLLRSYKEIEIASTHMILSAIVNSFLVATFTYYLKIYGFMIAMILSLLFNIFYIQWRRPFQFRFQVHLKSFRRIARFGLPLMLMGTMTTILLSVDRIMIAKFLGFTSLGYYTVALMIASYMTSFLNSLAIVLIPHYQEKKAEGGDALALRNFLSHVSVGYAALMPVLIGCAWITGPLLIRIALPDYTQGIPAMQMLLASTFFSALNQPYSDYLITIKKHYFLFPVLFVSFIAAISFNVIAIRSGYGITGIALATSLSLALKYSATYFYAVRHCQISFSQSLKTYFVLLSYGGYLLVCLTVLQSARLPNADSVMGMLTQLSLFAIMYSPLIYFINRRYDIIPLIVAYFRRKAVK